MAVTIGSCLIVGQDDTLLRNLLANEELALDDDGPALSHEGERVIGTPRSPILGETLSEVSLNLELLGAKEDEREDLCRKSSREALDSPPELLVFPTTAKK